jgi:hypothetical protein
MAERSIFLSEKQKKFTNIDKFYEYTGEVVMKRKEFHDKANDITSTVILEYICKDGLYHQRWIDGKNVGYGYEVLTSGYVVSYIVEDEKNSTMTEKIEYFDESQQFLAFDLVIKICQMLSA